MKRLLKRNQIVITTLAVMIAIAGYLHFAGNEFDGSSVPAASEDSLTEDAITDISEEDIVAENDSLFTQVSETTSEETEATSGMAEEAKEDIVTEEIESYDLDLTTDDTTATENTTATEQTAEAEDTPGEAVLTGTTAVTDFIAEARLEREQVRAKNKELLNEIINNDQIDEAQKQDAIDDMLALTTVAEKEAATEMLLEAKGFDEVVVSITDDSVDVVVNATNLSDEDRAKIEDIIKRKTGVSAENIVISPIHE